MTRLDQLLKLNDMLLEDMPQYKSQAVLFAKNEKAQWQLFRSLVNIRKPKPIPSNFLTVQDAFLQREISEKGITNWKDLQPRKPGIYLWQGDITTLKSEAIVNAANSGMTGCYSPCHGCIDNAIHTFAGVQLRNTCAEIMKKQGHPEPTGKAKITPAYNLPSSFIIHTVGPIVIGQLTEKHKQLLESCYRSCLDMADKNNLESITFCCISTGEFHFPHEEAAKIALRIVDEYHGSGGHCNVIFNVFGDKDRDIYNKLLL